VTGAEKLLYFWLFFYRKRKLRKGVLAGWFFFSLRPRSQAESAGWQVWGPTTALSLEPEGKKK
jgi:hypothetical protein